MDSLPALKQLCILAVLLLTLAGLDCATPPPPAAKPAREKYPHAASVNLAAGAFKAQLNFWVFDWTLLKTKGNEKYSGPPSYDTVASVDYSGVSNGQEFTYHGESPLKYIDRLGHSCARD